MLNLNNEYTKIKQMLNKDPKNKELLAKLNSLNKQIQTVQKDLTTAKANQVAASKNYSAAKNNLMKARLELAKENMEKANKQYLTAKADLEVQAKYLKEASANRLAWETKYSNLYNDHVAIKELIEKDPNNKDLLEKLEIVGKQLYEAQINLEKAKDEEEYSIKKYADYKEIFIKAENTLAEAKQEYAQAKKELEDKLTN